MIITVLSSEAPDYHQKLSNYIATYNLTISAFSREIIMIDYNITNNIYQFVTMHLPYIIFLTSLS